METTKCQLSGENLSHFTLVFLDTLSCRPPFQTTAAVVKIKKIENPLNYRSLNTTPII